MTAVVPATSVIPAPRPASEPARRPRREHPRREYWDATEARWVAAAR